MRAKPPEGRVEFAIWNLEQLLGRVHSAEERLAVEKTSNEIHEIHPMTRARTVLAFMRRLKTRQGTIMPDFAALYRKKAELDRKMSGHDEP